MRAPLPVDEDQRLQTLRRYRIVDTPPELTYDDLTLLASEICGTPIAAISLVDEDRQWFKSILGLDVRQTSRDVAFCAHAILQKDEPLIVEDATRDVRFLDNPLVTGEPGIRFYAGTPLVMSDGLPIGTLCVIDRVPKCLTAAQRRALQVLGREVVAQMELRRNVRDLQRKMLALARTEARLRRAQQVQLDLKDEFVSHVSHELRSPLTPIHQFVTILLDGLGGPLTGEQREYLGIVLRNTEQLRKMIGDLLEMTRAGEGKLRIDRRRFRLERLLADAVGSCRPSAEAAGLAISAEYAGPLPDVVGDVTRVRQVLSNLIENAIKFTGAGGSITVHAGVRPEAPDEVHVTVRDTGRGLAPAECARVFERLHQAGNLDARSRNGLGLGLYIAKSLVEAQGGRIWVESRPGEGSAFSFTLPAYAVVPMIAPLLSPENMARGEFSVITVDFVAARGRPEPQLAERAMNAAAVAVGASIHPATDLMLPRLGGAEAGETLMILAMADAQGATRVVERLKTRLNKEDIVREAGFELRISTAAFLLPPAAADAAATIARTLDTCLADCCAEGVA